MHFEDNMLCDVCRLIDGDRNTRPQPCFYCPKCNAWICARCSRSWVRRSLAAFLRRWRRVEWGVLPALLVILAMASPAHAQSACGAGLQAIPGFNVSDNLNKPYQGACWDPVTHTITLPLTTLGGGGNVIGTFTSGRIPTATGIHTLSDGSFTDNGTGTISANAVGLTFTLLNQSTAILGGATASIGGVGSGTFFGGANPSLLELSSDSNAFNLVLSNTATGNATFFRQLSTGLFIQSLVTSGGVNIGSLTFNTNGIPDLHSGLAGGGSANIVRLSGAHIASFTTPATTNSAITIPDGATGTMAVTASSPIVLNATTGDISCPTCSTSTLTLPITDGVNTALLLKPSVGLVATANLTLSGAQTIDGVLGTAGTTLVLATGQTAPAENGPWVMQAGAWNRPTWWGAGSTAQALQFSTFFVRLGTLFSGTTWRVTTANPITIDTTGVTIAETPLAVNATSVANGITGTGAVVLAVAPTITGTLTETSRINIGANGTVSGILGLLGITSGTATLTAPAVAGTSTNPITFSNVLALPNGTTTNPAYGFTANTTNGMLYVPGTGQVEINTTGGFLHNAGGVFFESIAGGIDVNAGSIIGWQPGNTPGAGVDAAIARAAAGVVRFTTGAQAASAGYAELGTVVVGSLPAAAAGNAGRIIRVSDSTAVAVEGQTCVGGGAVNALAFSSGAAWKCF